MKSKVIHSRLTQLEISAFSLLGAINSPIPTLPTPTAVRGTLSYRHIPEGKDIKGLS